MRSMAKTMCSLSYKRADNNMLMFEIDPRIKNDLAGNSRSTALKQQEQRIKIQLKQDQLHKARAKVNKLASQQTKLASKTV